MKNIRRLTVVFFGVLVFTAAVHAEMVPVSLQGAEFRQSPENCTRVNLQDNNLSCSFIIMYKFQINKERLKSIFIN